MKRWKTGLAIAVAGLALGGRVQAATPLYTAPANAGFGGDTFLCDAANVGSGPVTMSIEVRNYAGVAVDASVPFYLGAGEVVSQLSSNPGQAAYCKFTFTGSSKNIRAQAVYTRTNGSRTVVVPAK